MGGVGGRHYCVEKALAGVVGLNYGLVQSVCEKVVHLTLNVTGNCSDESYSATASEDRKEDVATVLLYETQESRRAEGHITLKRLLIS